MGHLRLEGLAHRALAHPLNRASRPIEEVLDALAAVVGEVVGRTLDQAPDAVRSTARAPHFLCSTIINTCFTVGDTTWPRFRNMLCARVPAWPPETFLAAYECAGWGYSIRYFLRHCPEARHFLVTILDANLYDFDFWRYSDHWERSGFGCTTLLLERTGEVDGELVVGAARGSNALAEFAMAIHRKVRGRTDCTAALPCFPEPIDATLRATLKQVPVLPNGHGLWGHCFGSDPWIALLREVARAPEERTYVACSLALNGYYALVEVDVAASERWSDAELRP